MLPPSRPPLTAETLRTSAVAAAPLDLRPPSTGGLRGAVADLMALAAPRRARDRIVVSAFVVGDLVFLALFVGFAYAEHYHLQDNLLYGRIEFSFVDNAYPELFGHLQLALVALLLVATHAKSRQAVHLALALLFAACALDDSLALHERFGSWLSTARPLSQGTGELLAWAAIGLIPAAAVAVGYLASDSKSRTQARALLLVFGLLLTFAIGVDQLHDFVRRTVGNLETLFTLLEDGGELVAITLACAVSVGIFRRYPRAHPAGFRPPPQG